MARGFGPISLAAVIVVAVADFPLAAMAAWAQVEPAGGAASTAGSDDAASRWGGWAMIAVGMVFFAVWLMPAGPRGGEGEQAHWTTRVPMLQALQRRMDKELTGWRRLQWPALGLFFTALGLATLMGWR